ncbi:MAG: hypothetical protein JNK02_10950 [Planctomycetes bacterium]|nr:hypothetical protein [Planctomycetota bacterium]
MPSLATLVRSFALALGAFAVPAAAQHEQLAPYAELRWQGERPEARLANAWVELLAIDGRAVPEIVAFCRVEWPDRWEQRFREDLVEVLTRMGRTPGAEVDLLVRDPGGGKERVVRCPMTAANREALRAAAAPAARPAIQRMHASVPDPRYAELARPLPVPGGAVLAREAALADLDRLEHALTTRFAYRDRLGVDVEAACDALRLSIAGPVTRATLALAIQRLVALFGDGHAGIEDLEQHFVPGCTPFLLADAEGGLVAFLEDRSAFLAASHPILESIDGRPVAEWVELAARTVPRGAPHFVRHHALRRLRFLAQLRLEAGFEPRERCTVGLRSIDGRERQTLELSLQSRKPVYGEWPRTKSRLLDRGVGYVRIADMQPGEYAAGIAAQVGALRGAPALVLDVRGNGGGTRDVLVAVAPWLLGADAPPRIVNVARPLRAEDSGPDALASRYLFPADHARWSDAARAAIAKFASGFTPEWEPRSAEFGAARYLVLERGPDAPRRPFAGRLAVLLDSGCFSATDVFLAALAELPNVILVGTPSGGGSGRARSLELERSGLVVTLSSMVSYRADGRLLEGRGVEPDVLVLPAPGDLVGRGDRVLDEALRRVR